MLRDFDGGPAPAAWAEDIAPITYPDGTAIPFEEVIDDALHPAWKSVTTHEYSEEWWTAYRKIHGIHPYEIACSCAACYQQWSERMGW